MAKKFKTNAEWNQIAQSWGFANMEEVAKWQRSNKLTDDSKIGDNTIKALKARGFRQKPNMDLINKARTSKSSNSFAPVSKDDDQEKSQTTAKDNTRSRTKTVQTTSVQKPNIEVVMPSSTTPTLLSTKETPNILVMNDEDRAAYYEDQWDEVFPSFVSKEDRKYLNANPRDLYLNKDIRGLKVIASLLGVEGNDLDTLYKNITSYYASQKNERKAYEPEKKILNLLENYF